MIVAKMIQPKHSAPYWSLMGLV